MRWIGACDAAARVISSRFLHCRRFGNVRTFDSASAPLSHTIDIDMHKQAQRSAAAVVVPPLNDPQGGVSSPETLRPPSWQRWLRWRQTSHKELRAAEEGVLGLLKNPWTQRQVDITAQGFKLPGQPPYTWCATTKPAPLHINTLTLTPAGGSDAPTLVCAHGYGAGLGFFFRNLDWLGTHFKVHAVDLLGWGLSSRPPFRCENIADTEAFFVSSLEAWRRAMGIDRMVLLGHSFGGYMAARYAIKYPEHVQHLLLVGPAGVGPPSVRLLQFRQTWKGAVANFIWERNTTPQSVVRFLGPWGPNIVRQYTSVRFGTRAQGDPLSASEVARFTDYMYHTIVAEGSGELALKYVFQLGATARTPLLDSVSELRVPTTFIYGNDDWMDYRAGDKATSLMTAPAEVIRVPNAGHYVFLDNAKGFHEAVLQACRNILPPESATIADVLKGMS